MQTPSDKCEATGHGVGITFKETQFSRVNSGASVAAGHVLKHPTG